MEKWQHSRQRSRATSSVERGERTTQFGHRATSFQVYYVCSMRTDMCKDICVPRRLNLAKFPSCPTRRRRKAHVRAFRDAPLSEEPWRRLSASYILKRHCPILMSKCSRAASRPVSLVSLRARAFVNSLSPLPSSRRAAGSDRVKLLQKMDY